MNKVEFSPAGGFQINRKLKESLMQENSIEPENITFNLLEDIKFKFTKVLHKSQSIEYFKPENVNKMKQSFVSFQSRKINISYYTLVSSMETLFGNFEEEEPNIAYSFLRCLMSVDQLIVKKLSQNVVISGGVANHK